MHCCDSWFINESSYGKACLRFLSEYSLDALASQATLIHGAERTSQVGVCIAAASVFLLSQQEAIQIINHQVKTIEQKWPALCEKEALSEGDQALFWQRQFLNLFAFINAPDGVHVPLPG